MNLAQGICVVGLLLLITAAGCFQPLVYQDPPVVEQSKPPATKVETQPAKVLPPAPDLTISYGDESDDGMVYFEHTNERLHYLRCLDRVEEILGQTSGPVNLTIRMGKRDLSWERDFDDRLGDIAKNERLKIHSVPARSSM